VAIGAVKVAILTPTVSPGAAAKGISLTWQSVIELLYRFTCWIISLLWAVLTIFVVWVGLKFMWARGDPTASGAAGKSLLYLLIGGVVLFSFGIIIATAEYYSNQVPGTSGTSLHSIVLPFTSKSCISF
jgi:hypothetical protein